MVHLKLFFKKIGTFYMQIKPFLKAYIECAEEVCLSPWSRWGGGSRAALYRLSMSSLIQVKHAHSTVLEEVGIRAID